MKSKKVREILKGIQHGDYFRELAELQNAIDDGITKSFIDYCRIFAGEYKTVDDLKQIRRQLVDNILDTLQDQSRFSYSKKMPADHYARYFHALAILQVDKGEVDVDSDDQMLHAFYQLWLRDDGSKGFWRTIDAVSWSISEAIKCLKQKR